MNNAEEPVYLNLPNYTKIIDDDENDADSNGSASDLRAEGDYFDEHTLSSTLNFLNRLRTE